MFTFLAFIYPVSFLFFIIIIIIIFWQDLYYNVSGLESKWFHITATYDETIQTGKLYINGKLVAKQTGITKGVITDDPVYIGAVDTSYPFRGLADEIRMFNHTFTDEEVANTWDKPLTKGNMSGVMFYYNADGDGYNKFIDKSGNGRNGTLRSYNIIDRLSYRSNVIANCEGCFDGSELSFCIPNEENTGYCGDGEMLGNKQCDGGEFCSDNCTCPPGYFGDGYGGCKAYNGGCSVLKTLADCAPALKPGCDCDCFNVSGAVCLYDHGCYTDFASESLYRTWEPCITTCSGNKDVCYRDGKQQQFNK